MRAGFALVALAAPWAAEAHLDTVDWSRVPDSLPAAVCHDRAAAVEAMAHQHEASWPYDVPRADVAAELIACHEVAAALSDAHPDNAELWLLQGIYGWYLNNLEQEAFAEGVRPALARARALDPDGLRADWIEANFLAHSGRAPVAVERMAAIEERLGEAALPAAFWWDYAQAAHLAWMPAHALRALDLAEAGGYSREEVVGLRDLTRGAFLLDPAAATPYADADVWYAADLDRGVICNRMFSFCVTLPSDWQVQLLQTRAEATGLLLVPPAYPTPVGRVNASILLLAVTAGDRPLETFLYDGVKRKRAIPAETTLEGARAIEVIDPRTYRRLGGAHAVKVVVAHDRPRWPGLAAEAPLEHELATGTEAPQPVPRLDRVAGVVQYSLLLDIGEAAYGPARADFDRLLATLMIEGALSANLP